MKPEISIVMPAIRCDRWDEVYKSIFKSTKRNFELIIVSPFPLTSFLQNKSNVKYVKDFGAPMRANCIGSLLCEGKFVFPTHSDDGLFIEEALDKNIDYLLSFGDNIKNIVICKYSESSNREVKNYQPDSYYKLVNAYPVNRNFVPEDWWIFNSAIWHREYFDTFGGWDCVFEACPMGHADLAIRAQRDGALVHLSPFPLADLDHMPGLSGDHGPIHIAQHFHDEQIFKDKYNSKLDDYPIRIDYNNWKNSEMIWSKRFKIENKI